MTAVTTWAAAIVQTAPQRVLWGVRGTVLALCVVAAGLGGHLVPAAAFAVVIVLLAAIAAKLPAESVQARLGRVAELILTCAAIFLTGDWDSPFFMYLCVPTLAAGLFSGVRDAAAMAVLSAVLLPLLGGAVTSRPSIPELSTLTQYVFLTAIIGLVAAWARHLLRRESQQRELPPAAASAADQPLVDAAHRLLTQLRTVARQLPGTLDPVTVASQLLDDVCQIIPARRFAVFGRLGAGGLVPLAGNAEEAPEWDVEVSGESPFAEAWATQQRQLVPVGPGWLVVVPLLVGYRTVGLVAVESDAPPPTPDVLDELSQRCAEAALRIETALLFNDIRDIATTEERQRLAREIHDGVAQELVIVGYAVDNVLADLPPDQEKLRAEMSEVRAEVTRIISELRLSLFDLRSHVDPAGGLGAAIAAHVRTIGTTSGLTVHLTLNESVQRLPAATEAELFRIVQEAVTNARKHARAQNIWVSVDVNPPAACLSVVDDGVGMSGDVPHNSYGQMIMRERAARIGAELEIGSRPDGGTAVEVRLGGAGRRWRQP